MISRGLVVIRRGEKYRQAVLLTALACMALGCENESFLPPPSAPSAQDRATAVGAANIELVLDDTALADHKYLAREAHVRAAQHKLMLNHSNPAPGEPPAQQAGLIRAALDRHPSVLVVRPAAGPEVAAALRDVIARGVPLVLLDRPVPGLGESAPVTLVTYAPFADSAADVVSAAKAAAKNEGLRDDGVAILLVNTVEDCRSTERVAALRRAIVAAGIRLAETQMFSGRSQNGEPNLVAKLDSDPKVTMVFADEDRGISCAHHTAAAQLATHRFVVAGYSNTALTPPNILDEVTVADPNWQSLVDQAIDTAVLLSRGERAPSRIEILHPVRTAIRPPRPL